MGPENPSFNLLENCNVPLPVDKEPHRIRHTSFVLFKNPKDILTPPEYLVLNPMKLASKGKPLPVGEAAVTVSIMPFVDRIQKDMHEDYRNFLKAKGLTGDDQKDREIVARKATDLGIVGYTGDLSTNERTTLYESWLLHHRRNIFGRSVRRLGFKTSGGYFYSRQPIGPISEIMPAPSAGRCRAE